MHIDYLHTTNELLQHFVPVTLDEMNKVKLMDRVDSKYVLSFHQLSPVLKNLTDHYRVLTIANNRVFSYRTEYYDTPELDMFADHHNGKLNRFKVRQREYLESKLSFLEVKFKSNTGRVIKDRIEKAGDNHQDFSTFVHSHTPYNPDKLAVTIINRFNRFTLVDHHMQERVTMDFNLSFSDRDHDLDLNGLVIIEVKQNKNRRQSSIFKTLKDNNIRPESFSKYCLGVSLLNRHKKFNNFKKTIILVNKLSHFETNKFA
jgi:hypothetical protein